MILPSWIAAALVALVVTNALTPGLRRFARRIGAIDYPGGRRINVRPMPRLGGVAIYVGFLAALLVATVITRDIVFTHRGDVLTIRIPLSPRADQAVLGILLGSTFLFLVGIWDDARGLHPALKFLLQVAAGAVLIPFGLSTQFVTHPLTGRTVAVGPLGPLFTIVWVVGVVNATNFIDGVDGLASGIAAIAGTTLLLTAMVKGDATSMLLAACLIGSMLGFLRHNFNPARIIMGDSGSMFVGYVLGGISVMGLYKSYTALSLAVPLLALAVPIVDTAFAIVRRFRSRQPIYLPDRGHLHHRLLDRGLSQRQTVLLLYLVSAFFGVGALAVAGVNRTASVVTLAVIAAALYVGARRMGLLERKAAAVRDTRGGGRPA
ncbi:MAG: MraY family glycosyltransferase [Armatimonadota bacterium]|nr:MraY family glycosyltransferase [Armatimonadota bacterium]MDR7464495.1 MraY family glycosyltransferase [Armatimonadota bacterium]MDR7470237.1 MraY family glycosyltransferase [Armatimonadota bacterium]MDR7473394.1 MraY family glycosyltransferase [Armatimonadota bacterium]MDR7538437.1 MraY family glycosyltransferase [Armatimonadota bacterium]